MRMLPVHHLWSMGKKSFNLIAFSFTLQYIQCCCLPRGHFFHEDLFVSFVSIIKLVGYCRVFQLIVSEPIFFFFLFSQQLFYHDTGYKLQYPLDFETETYTVSIYFIYVEDKSMAHSHVLVISLVIYVQISQLALLMIHLVYTPRSVHQLTWMLGARENNGFSANCYQFHTLSILWHQLSIVISQQQRESQSEKQLHPLSTVSQTNILLLAFLSGQQWLQSQNKCLAIKSPRRRRQRSCHIILTPKGLSRRSGVPDGQKLFQHTR